MNVQLCYSFDMLALAHSHRPRAGLGPDDECPSPQTRSSRGLTHTIPGIKPWPRSGTRTGERFVVHTHTHTYACTLSSLFMHNHRKTSHLMFHSLEFIPLPFSLKTTSCVFHGWVSTNRIGAAFINIVFNCWNRLEQTYVTNVENAHTVTHDIGCQRTARESES